MKIYNLTYRSFLCRQRGALLLVFLYSVFASISPASAQGTITFNNHPYFAGTSYNESGVHFGLVVPTYGTGSPNYDSFGGTSAITSPANVPYDNTPYFYFYQQFSPDDYVAINLTSGSSFGLSSVQLADPTSPSSTELSITFWGTKSDGSTVSETFTTLGNGATTFQTYQFDSDFSSGLTSAWISSTRWAMDNLVVTIPEPGTLALFGLGGCALFWMRTRKRQRG